jgi:adenosine deaminase
VDVAGDESRFDARRYAGPLARASEAGLGVTVHAGESGDASNVAEAVTTLGADRIGHGVGAASDQAVMALLADRQVAVEVCLSSNLHTGAVSSLDAHPFLALAAAGVPVALATDNTFFSATTLSREYELASRAGAGSEILRASVLTGAEAAFLPGEERAALRELLAASLGVDSEP